jgi:hypothetical protein
MRQHLRQDNSSLARAKFLECRTNLRKALRHGTHTNTYVSFSSSSSFNLVSLASFRVCAKLSNTESVSFDFIFVLLFAQSPQSCLRGCACACACACACVCVCVRARVCVCVCVHTYMHTYMHTYIRKFTSKQSSLHALVV